MRERKERKEKKGKEPEQKTEKEKIDWKDRQAWMGLASACLAVVLAIVLIIAFAGGDQPAIDAGNVNSSTSGSDGGQQPVDEDLGMGLPIEAVSVSNEYGFFYNQTLDCYYHHDGVDFLTEAGANVLAAEDGVVESVYSGDVLKGTEIVLDHGNGLKTVYRFVVAVDGLSVGDEVKQGDVIATVAEATGNEYKDGAHLHFEILENGETVDPTVHLDIIEK